jgi:hypothetical protein
MHPGKMGPQDLWQNGTREPLMLQQPLPLHASINHVRVEPELTWVIDEVERAGAGGVPLSYSNAVSCCGVALPWVLDLDARTGGMAV